MTDTNDAIGICAVCGHQQVLATHAYVFMRGSPDLDLRPPSLQRRMLGFRVQCCEACGYCSDRIELPAHSSVKATLQRTVYSATLTRSDWPLIARRMACWTLIEDGAGCISDAGWAALMAAWAFEDHNLPALAASQRELAARFFVRSIEAGEPPYSERGLSDAVLADIWRRAGRFQEALLVASTGLAMKSLGGLERRVEDMLSFQLQLAGRCDADRHLISDAERAAPDWAEREAVKTAERAELASRAAARQRSINEQQERESPAAFVRALAGICGEFAHARDLADQDPAHPPEQLQSWMRYVPMPFSMVAIMEANVRNHSWPVAPMLAAIGLAVLVQVDDSTRREFREAESIWRGISKTHVSLRDHLFYCLRDTKPNVWRYAPPQRRDEGPARPNYDGNRALD